MPHPTFRQLPRYQRAVRRRETQREAEGYAVPQLDDIVSDFSKEQAAREEYGAGRAVELGLQERGFKLKGERLDLRRKRFEVGKELTTEHLAARKKIADRSFAIDREMMSAQKEQNKWATGIGIVNVGIEGMGAVASVRAAEKEAEQYQLMTDTFMEMLELQKKRLY